MRRFPIIAFLTLKYRVVEGFVVPCWRRPQYVRAQLWSCASEDLSAENVQKQLEQAFGAGKGKHAGPSRRRHSNKYSSKSKATNIDPWDLQLQKAEEAKAASEGKDELKQKLIEARREERRRDRGEAEYPDEEDIDPYDPSTFGFIEVGHILGAHGVKGEVKLRSNSDFGPQRLCVPGTKHMKAPNRRFPRDIELLSGRHQKEDIYLVQLEGVSTRDAAAGLRGHKIYVCEEERPDLMDGEYMIRDLVGAGAYDANDDSVYLGEVVGVVIGDDISGTAGLANDLLELHIPAKTPGDATKVCYVPFVPQIVPTIVSSPENRCVLLDLPEGLLDLAVEVQEKAVVRGFLPEKVGDTGEY